MSLILEALRRSEAERRRAAPPRLLDPAEPRRRRESRWPVALAGLLGGLLIAGAGLWAWRSTIHDPPAGTTGVPTPRPEPATPPPPSPSTASAPVDVARDTIPAAAYAPAVDPTPAAPPPSVVPPPAPAPLAPPADRAIAPIVEPLATGAATGTATEGAPATLDPAAPGNEAGRGPRPGDLALGALSGGARGALPPLRVSMHVYADDPARRFAIIDGQRLREGDPIGGAAQLLEIRRDGLRVAWQGGTLWVPR
jgi:general secretion pathway protein B